MRDLKACSEILVKTLEASLNDDSFADKAAIEATIDAIRAKSHPSEPYAAAARSQLRMMGFGDLCVMPEEA
jgi:hypothetical protein